MTTATTAAARTERSTARRLIRLGPIASEQADKCEAREPDHVELGPVPQRQLRRDQAGAAKGGDLNAPPRPPSRERCQGERCEKCSDAHDGLERVQVRVQPPHAE